MKTAFCLDCDRSIKLDDRLRIGNVVECPHCESEFQLVQMDPPELEWLYDLEDWEEEEEEEEEDLRHWSWKIAKRGRLNSFERPHERGRTRGKQSEKEFD